MRRLVAAAVLLAVVEGERHFEHRIAALGVTKDASAPEAGESGQDHLRSLPHLEAALVGLRLTAIISAQAAEFGRLGVGDHAKLTATVPPS